MNFDLQALLAQYLGTNPALYMVLGVAALIVINLIVTLWLAAKSNSIQFHLLGDFVTPTITHTLFLVTMGVLTFSTKGIPALTSSFGALQGLGFAAVMTSYGSQIYMKLKQIGMPVTPQVDQEIQQKFDEIIGKVTQNTPIYVPPAQTVIPVTPTTPVTVTPVAPATPTVTPQSYVPSADAVLITSVQKPKFPEEDGR